MVDRNDLRAIRAARTEFTKRQIDISRAEIYAIHGVLYLRGSVTAFHSAHLPDIHAEIEHIARAVRQKAAIREVVNELRY